MSLTIPEIRERQALLNGVWRASKAKKQEVYGRLMKELEIDPASVDDLRAAGEAIKNTLSLLEKFVHIRAQDLGPGVRVRRKSHPEEEGGITAIRGDGCLQVKLDGGRTVGWSPFNVQRLN